MLTDPPIVHILPILFLAITRAIIVDADVIVVPDITKVSPVSKMLTMDR